MNFLTTFEQMEHDIYYDPQYVLGMSLFAGFLFASWSLGIAFYFAFLIAWEIGVFIYYDYNGYHWNLQTRIGILFGSLFGFLIGRAIIEDDDHEQNIKDFKNKISEIMKYCDIL